MLEGAIGGAGVLKKFASALLMMCLLCPVAWGGDWNYLSQSLIAWQPYGKAVFEQARRKQQPLFVLVYSDQCHWCRKYELQSIETDGVQRRLQQDYLPVAVDVLKQPVLAQKLGAIVVPTTLLLTPDGKRIAKFHGFVDERDLSAILDENLRGWRKGDIKAKEFGNEATCCSLPDTDQKR